MLEYMAEWEQVVGSMKDDPREHIILALSEVYMNHPVAMKNIEEKWMKLLHSEGLSFT